MLAVDTAAAEAPSNNGSPGVEQNGREQDDPPVIDTTSVEVQRKADGKQTQAHEHSMYSGVHYIRERTPAMG